MRILESDKLLIKPTEESDLNELMQLRWDADVMSNLLHEPIGMKQQMEWFKNISAKDIVMTIFLKSEENLNIIGTTGLYNINMRHQTATLKIRISPTAQGKGIGPKLFIMILDYAFGTLNLRKICSDNFSENEGVAKLKGKLGFVKEGTLRKHYYHNGEFRDADIYNLLKEDYYKSEKVQEVRNTIKYS
ncbi:MAG: GNAT family protein [Ginsengibacter sp.]